MNISVLLVLGMLFSSSQGHMGIPNCNFTNPIGHQQVPCCLEECDHTSEKTICEYDCPKDMFLSHNMLWDKNGGSLCSHGCRQTCPENYDGIKKNDIQICVECFILCRLEIPHTSCKCQKEKIENEESSLETKDYIIIALAITSFLLFVGLVMVGCYWKRKRNKDNTKPTENIEMRSQNKDISIKDDGNIQETEIEIESVDNTTRYVIGPTKPVVNTMKKCQSTQRIESYVYDYATGPSFGSTPDPSGGNAENMVQLGKYRHTEVDATEINTSSTSNARPALTPSIDDGHEFSSFTQERSYENTNNDHLERQPREHVPDDNDIYEIPNNIKNATNALGGKSNLSSVPSSTEGGAEAFLDDGCEMTLQPSYENMLIANNECLGNQTREHDPGEDDLYEIPITMKIATNVSGGKSNRSSAISSDSSENGNQVDTVSDTSSSYETARESSTSSTESGAEARVTKNTANSKIKASGYRMNITAKNITFNIAN